VSHAAAPWPNPSAQPALAGGWRLVYLEGPQGPARDLALSRLFGEALALGARLTPLFEPAPEAIAAALQAARTSTEPQTLIVSSEAPPPSFVWQDPALRAHLERRRLPSASPHRAGGLDPSLAQVGLGEALSPQGAYPFARTLLPALSRAGPLEWRSFARRGAPARGMGGATPDHWTSLSAAYCRGGWRGGARAVTLASLPLVPTAPPEEGLLDPSFWAAWWTLRDTARGDLRATPPLGQRLARLWLHAPEAPLASFAEALAHFIGELAWAGEEAGLLALPPHLSPELPAELGLEPVQIIGSPTSHHTLWRAAPGPSAGGTWRVIPSGPLYSWVEFARATRRALRATLADEPLDQTPLLASRVISASLGRGARPSFRREALSELLFFLFEQVCGRPSLTDAGRRYSRAFLGRRAALEPLARREGRTVKGLRRELARVEQAVAAALWEAERQSPPSGKIRKIV